MEPKVAFAEANSFLAPVIYRGENVNTDSSEYSKTDRLESISKSNWSSVVECLALKNGLERNDESDARFVVIQKALDLLSNIHLSLKSIPGTEPNIFENLSERKVLDGLLDLISLEGIYPFLSPGVGIPIERRVKSVIQAGFATRPSPATGILAHNDERLLPIICIRLHDIAMGRHLDSVFRDRILVDLVAGLGELCYSPLISHDARQEWVDKLNILLEKTPTLPLLSILTSLLQPATPTWFRSPITTSLSLLPLRSEGVRHTINFIASAMSAASFDPDGSPNKTEGKSFSSSLSLEVLSQSSKLLSSVPSSLDPNDYFSALAPQLLKLLDDSFDDTKRAAAYIIGNGILGRRKYSSPGSIGWTLFMQPIIECFNPGLTQDQANPVPDFQTLDGGLSSIIVSEDNIRVQLGRLASLVLFHPNPGLTKRLIGPSVRSLWSFLCFSHTGKHRADFEKARQVLAVYFKTSANFQELLDLTNHILWEGDSSWTYSIGLSGGLEIRKRSEDSARQHDMIGILQDINSRVDEFLNLLKSGVANDDEIGTIFAHTCKHWLFNETTKTANPRIGDDNDAEQEPLYSLMYATFTQRILDTYKDKIAASPVRVIQLVNQLLSAFVASQNEAESRIKRSPSPSLTGLKHIIDPAISPSSSGPIPSQEDFVDLVSVALSIVSAIMSSPEFSLTPEVSGVLELLHENLVYFSSPNPKFPASITVTAKDIISLLDLYDPSSSSANTTTKPTDPYVEDRKTHTLALVYLNDPVPPVRAQGLSLLTTLISKLTPILDIPSSCILLHSLLQDNDDFIYLSAIKALGLLASRHSKTVVRMLLEQYIDKDEISSLDVRIRTGEALLKTIENLGTALVGETATLIGEAMIAVAGRRSERPKTKELREQEIREEAALQVEAEAAWDGPVPSMVSSPPEAYPDDQILAAWASPTISEDPRIRTSALSILSACIETSITGLGASIISTSLDLVLSVLQFEPEPDKSIIRRAAVLLIGSLVTALELAADEGRHLGFGLQARGLEDIMRVLDTTGRNDRDDIVRGHVGVVVEKLESWRRTGWERGDVGGELKFGLRAGGLRGLMVNPEAGGRRAGGIQEIE